MKELMKLVNPAVVDRRDKVEVYPAEPNPLVVEMEFKASVLVTPVIEDTN